MEQTRAELDRRFGIAGLAHVQEGHGGLLKVRVTSRDAAAEMYLHGAHVVSWKPAEAEEVFFVSRDTLWEPGRAIRGGVPVCFPWFGNRADNPSAPAHGFVRSRAWPTTSGCSSSVSKRAMSSRSPSISRRDDSTR